MRRKYKDYLPFPGLPPKKEAFFPRSARFALPFCAIGW
jgi:hypothetical protein